MNTLTEEKILEYLVEDYKDDREYMAKKWHDLDLLFNDTAIASDIFYIIKANNSDSNLIDERSQDYKDSFYMSGEVTDFKLNQLYTAAWDIMDIHSIKGEK